MKTFFTQSVRHVEGIATDLLVRIRGAYVPADFVIFDMLNDRDAPLILGYPFLKDLVYSQGRMTDSINKKLHANDKMLEIINAKLDDFSSAMKNQLSFNKMLETQLAQLAAAIPSFEKGKIPSKPEEFMETANLVTSRYDFGLDGSCYYMLYWSSYI